MNVDVARLPDNVACLRPLLDADIIGATEVHLASFVLASSPLDDPELAHHVAWGLAAATWSMLHGHDCADLGQLADVVRREQLRHHVDSDTEPITIEWPRPDVWLAALRRAAIIDPSPVRLTDAPDEVLDERPLVVSGERVYLQRYWIDECVVARGITDRAALKPAETGPTVRSLLDRLLPDRPDGSRDASPAGAPRTNQQRVAAEAVLANSITVIAGGPGTGKTYSVARVLAALYDDARQHRSSDLRVALAAPTGKAAQRLAETIRSAVSDLRGVVADETIEQLVALRPTTIHGLLGAFGLTGRFRRNASHPLDHDVVVIDETSMVSLPLAARLLDALRPETRLVIVGDPDQLESVEVGAILADLVAARTGVLADRVVRLTESHRFQGDSPIALLAAAVQRQDGDAASALLRTASDHDLVETGASSTVRFVDTAVADSPAAVQAVRAMIEPSLQAMVRAAEAGEAEAALDALAATRILCAHRRGPAGVARWNVLAEGWMRGPRSGRQVWYPGRPVLVTKNDQRLGLSNGDTGVVIRRGDQLEVVFPRAGSDPVAFPTIALADVETCFAMTVHKSQGSEYPSVALVLPPARSPLIGRELAYTGISRARNHLLVVGSADVLAECAASPAQRMSGLRQALGAR